MPESNKWKDPPGRTDALEGFPTFMRWQSLVFALLEFCFLVSCAGFNLDSIEGEKLPTFAKTLKTGAIRDPR